MQYLLCAALIVERLIIFVIVILFFSVFTITINYILLYLGFLKVQALAEKVMRVKVKRNGKF